MNTRIYLNEWFINAGIVGFLRILEHNKQDFVKKEENYIEFDTEDLKDFHKYYFNYFFDNYNIAKKMEKRISESFGRIENLLENKDKKDTLKREQKYIKDSIKKELDKIKKVDENVYKTMFEAYSKIDKVHTKEELDEIQEILINNFKIDKINRKTTLNLFKNILSKNYFGQPSFFNVVKNSLSYEEQQNLMYKDYINNIIEADTIKNKQQCSICGEDHFGTSKYTESNFVPLAVSSDNMANFFWNQNTKVPICDMCKLILFCIPAGVTTVIKTVKDNGKYKEKEMLSFVNYDTDVENLLITNNNFSMQAKREKTQYSPYADMILDIVSQNKKISEWQLQNIFVVEFEAEYLAYSRMEYFNIKRHTARFFIKYSKFLTSIVDYKYRVEIIDYILKNKDINIIINRRLRESFTEKSNSGYSSLLATKVKVTLEVLKGDDNDMEEKVKKANNKINLMFSLGREIKDKLRKDNNENKLDGYIYKMLNCIKTNNKDDFTDIAIRTLWSMGKDIPEILVKNNEDITWQELGHSFIAGLTSNIYEKKDEVGKDE